MHLWFPFCSRDKDRATEWLQWAGELGFNRGHTIVLHPAMELGRDHPAMVELAQKAFEHVLIEPDREGHTGWPEGPNCAFRQAAWYFYGKTPWLFQESDAWPLVPEWLERIEADYKACGKPFMGDLSPAGKGYQEHLSGVAVYPANMPDYSAKTVMAHAMAFDVSDPFPLVQNMHKTPLIQHVFFINDREIPDFRDMESMKLIRSDAVLFHRCKTPNLARRLREKMRGGAVPEVHRADESKHIVYTYHDNVPGMGSQEWLLARWANSWKAAGFTPIVLSKDDAKTHKHWAELEKRFASYPTINPTAYETACYFRYIALVQRGGGMMTDADVMNYGFTPEDLQAAIEKAPNSELPTIMLDASPCPCVVYGTAEQFNNAVTWFANNQEKCTKMERGRPHASDQTGVQSGPPWTAYGVAIQYGVTGHEKAPLVHYCHAACAGRPREQVIPEAEKLREHMLMFETFSSVKGLDAKVYQNMEVKSELAHTRIGAGVDPAHPSVVTTWIDGIRTATNHLLTESKASDNNRTRVMNELKKAGLVPGGVKYAPKPRRKKAQKRKAVAA